MKILMLLCSLYLSCGLAFADNDADAAKDFLFCMRNEKMFDFMVTQDPEQLKRLAPKFEQAISNLKKSGISLSKIQIINAKSIENLGTNKRVVLVIYQTEDKKYWDDIVIYVENEKNLVCDIGQSSNIFTLNEKLAGQNDATFNQLPFLFDKKAITYPMVIEETQKLIRLAKKNDIDSLCPMILYTGPDTQQRKNRREASNPKDANDLVLCNTYKREISGKMSDPFDNTLQWKKIVNQEVSLSLQCNQSKNRMQVTYSIINRKLLLSFCN